MSLQDQIRDDVKESMRLGQSERRDTLRFLLAELRNATIERQRLALEAEYGQLGRELTDAEARRFAAQHDDALSDDEVRTVLTRMAKRHRQSIDEFHRAGREDLVAHEQAQLAIVQFYLPAQVGTDELTARVRAAIAETGAKGRRDMGKVMARLADLRGKADMSEVSRITQSLLA